jgi:putative flippase GtrA
VQVLLVTLLAKSFAAAVAAPLAVEVAVLHNFFWHERFTWPDRRGTGIRQLAARLWRFHAGNGLISLAGNTALLYVLVDRLHAPVLPSAIAAIAICSLANFVVADRWVYAVPAGSGEQVQRCAINVKDGKER